jgi:hypothetical protein
MACPRRGERKMKSGFYGAVPKLPEEVQKAMESHNPPWDWLQTGQYIVLRLFDEGEEYERVAAKILVTQEIVK